MQCPLTELEGPLGDVPGLASKTGTSKYAMSHMEQIIGADRLHIEAIAEGQKPDGTNALKRVTAITHEYLPVDHTRSGPHRARNNPKNRNKESSSNENYINQADGRQSQDTVPHGSCEHSCNSLCGV